MKGIIGLILAGIGYALVGSILLEIVYEKKFVNYKALLKDVMGQKRSIVLEWTVNIFLFICFSAMIAGAGAGFSNIVGSIFPIFGYIGLFEIIMILVYYSLMKWEHRRK